jgi:hypothetical protein
MHRSPLYSLAALLILATACAERPTGPAETNAAPAASIVNNNLDLDGTPDLIVREDIMKQQWVVRDENLPATYCSVIEGGVTPGVRRLIRFTVMTPNIGDADLYIGDPNQYVNADGSSELYEYADCHGHYHFKHYALYELVDASTGKVWKAAKRGFCMLDTDPNPEWLPGERDGSHNFMNCGTPRSAGNQGITHGWTDTYRFTLGGQYFVLDGGDGQPPVPPGDYLIRITVNPAYAPIKGKCPRSTNPATGLCHQFTESSYANNQVSVPVHIPAHVGRDGEGPLKGSDVLKYEPAEH